VASVTLPRLKQALPSHKTNCLAPLASPETLAVTRNRRRGQPIPLRRCLRLLSLGLAVCLALSAAASAQLIDVPWSTFDGQTRATVCWETAEPSPTVFEIVAPGGEWTVRRNDEPTRLHSVTLTDLKRNTEYHYRVRLGEQTTPEYILDTEYDFSVPELPLDAAPFPRDALTAAYERAAREILKRSGIDRGYCLDLGCGEGRLSYEIARRARLRVVGFSTNREAIDRGRKQLIAQGVYGSRVTLRYVPSLDQLPLPDLCANLIVSGEAVAGAAPSASAEAVARKLRPCGGRAYIGGSDAGLRGWLTALPTLQGIDSRLLSAGTSRWAVLERPGPLPGAGEWTHAYGTAGQTANSNDELVNGVPGKTLEVQWFGLPGPNAMLDRQVRMEGPLSANGRLFALGWDRVMALDAYNGAILWSVEIPDSRRTNIPRNCGNACVDTEHLFLAVGGHCWRFNAATGEREATYPADETGGAYEWGYVGLDGDRLLGSAVRVGNMDREYAGWDAWFDDITGPDILCVGSDTLFADRIADGARLWTHSGGLVLNPTVAIGYGRVFFLESHSAAATASPVRKLGAEAWSDVWLAALETATGALLWEQRYEAPTQPTVTYVVYHAGEVGVVASYQGEYYVTVRAADTGDALWEARHQWRSDNHGHHIQHPVIAQGRVFLEPNVYDWKTGARIDITFPSRSKCGTITGAANLLHYRDYNDEVWDLNTDTQTEFPGLRSNCWLGLISGNGLLMSPVSAGGCSCQWPVYTSLAYRVKDDY